MRLITCGAGKKHASLGHPCGRAARALDEAGHTYRHDVAPGYRAAPWTRRGDARAEVEELSGQDNVPILVLDDGSVIAGSSRIVDWARANPA
jgi:glutathione S-transferase